MKKFLFLIVALVIFIPCVNAETFTQPSRFQYFLYRSGSDTPVSNGTGLIDSYGGSGFNRVQFLYNLYTFDPNYLYDITFTAYFDGSLGTQTITADLWGESCQIYTGSGAQYNCTYSGGRDGNYSYMRSSITNMIGTNLNTLWLNFYTTGNIPVNFIQTSYKLEINRKENKNVTSENLQNATDSIINNQNQNNNALRSDINDGVDHIVDSQNNINNSINNSNVDDPSSSINSFQNMLATNGVITQLVTLPVTLFTKVLNSVNGTCSNYNLGSLLGTDLILPCINIQSYLGSTLWSVIDVLISGLFVYAISRKFIKVFENLSSMKDGDVISD